jgi:hypothetical protein
MPGATKKQTYDRFVQERKNLENEFDKFVTCNKFFLKMPGDWLREMKGKSCNSVAQYMRDEFRIDFSDGVLILVLRSYDVKLEIIDPDEPYYRILDEQPEDSILNRKG